MYKDKWNLVILKKIIYENHKAKGLWEDLDMDYEEEFVGDENEL